MVMPFINSRPIGVQVLQNKEAPQVLDDNGKVIGAGEKMDRIRIDAFPEEGGRFDFSGFIETGKDSPYLRLVHFVEKMMYSHMCFDGVVDDQRVEVFVRTESVRKRLGIGEKELNETAKRLGIWRDFTGIWKRDVMKVLFDPYYCEIQHAQDQSLQARKKVFHLLQPRLEWIQERRRNPRSERHRLSKEERDQIQLYVTSNRESLPSLEEGAVIEISKADSGLSHDLIFTSYPSALGECSIMRLLIVLDKAHDIEEKELYPVIDFYRPEERLFIAYESAGGVAAHERAMRGWIRRFPLVSQPIAMLPGNRELFSVDRELARIQEEYPVITDSSDQQAEDLICHVEALHQEGVLLGAFNPITYVEEQGEFGPVARGALLGLEYATTPQQRAADAPRETLNWGNPLYFAPEVAREAYARRAKRKIRIAVTEIQAKALPERVPVNPFSEASDMWVLGLRLMNLLQNPAHVLRGQEPQNDLERLEQIGALEEGGLPEPEDRCSMQYLAYLMLKVNPEERITAREALRCCYGIVVNHIVARMKGPVEASEGWRQISALLGRDMRSDHLSQDRIRELIAAVRSFAEAEGAYARECNQILICLNQLFLHPSE